jgi:ATP-dependent helicase/nuclease subunit B
MSLQFVLGNSGSGKTEYAFGQLVREAGEHPLKNYLVIVPEQFTMQTQKKLVELAPNHAIMNVDVLSFKRLAYRVFDDLGKNDIQVLEETGKNLILRKVAKDRQEQLTVLRPNMSRMGYIGEVKSLISELVQYNISPEQLEDYSRRGDISPAFAAKLCDIVTMYRGFEDYMRGSFVTAEEILNVLIALADESELLRDSVIVFDEFTGFTPIQNRLLQKILPVAESIRVILTIDSREDFYRCAGNHELFYLSKKTIASLSRMAQEMQVEILDPVVLGDSANRRFLHAPDLSFMEQNLFRVRAQKNEKDVEEIRISSWKNPREELTGIAREINRLVRQENYRYRDIAVVTGAVDTYGNYVEEIFGTCGIPYFLDQTTEVLFHPFIECIRAALQVLADDFSYEPIMRLLRTGFVPLDEETIDMLDNYLLAAGIRGRKAWEKRWVREPRQKECYDLALINEARIVLVDLFAPMAEVFCKKESTLGDKVLALYGFLVAIGAEERLWEREKEYLLAGKQEQSKIDGQIYQIVIKLLEKCNQLLGEEPMDIDDFSELLDAGLSAAKVAVIPPGYDCVTIGDIERTRLNRVKVLFFAGVNDGIIPKAGNAGGIISEYEREMMQEADLELAPGAREQAFTQRFYLYRNLTKPSERLYLSYARVDRDGKAQRVSYLISTVHKLFPNLKTAYCEDIEKEADFSTKQSAVSYLIHGEHKEDWFALAKYYFSTEEAEQVGRLLTAPYQRYTDDAISRAVARAVYGKNLEASATRLERFAACAYAHFLEYGLKLKERELAGFESVDIGNLYHAALERYSSKLKEQNLDWFLISDTDRDRIAAESMDEAAESTPYLLGYATAADTHLLERMRAIFKQTVWALTKQVRAGHFVPTDFEISFSQLDTLDSLKVMLDTENQIRLLGRIDRLDVCEDAPKIYVKVIDYKSGGMQFDLVRVYQGLSLQLAVYMSAGMELCRKNHPDETVLPGGILYYHIDDPVLEEPEGSALSEEEIEHAILASLRPDGLVNREEEIIRAFDEHLEKKSEVIPVELKKDGALYESRSHVASTREFEIIETYVRNCIKSQGQDIYNGKISVNPYRDGNECSCNYCPYDSVCGMDEKIPGYGYRSLEKIPKEEVLLHMETENVREAARAAGKAENAKAREE